MVGKRIQLPSSLGTDVHLDLYVPMTSQEIDPDVKRPAVVICPGGAYAFCSEREAEPVALRFLIAGFNAFVLWYRVAPNRYPIPQQDAAAAVAWVRAHAQETHTDPSKIAILGFSAGGHLAGSLGALWHRADLWEPMGLTPDQVRPNAMVLCYPVISGGEKAHRGSFENLSGSSNVKDHAAFSVDEWVTPHCPPAFIWHTFEDEAVPVENSLLMANALAKQGILTELHVFPRGIHGASLCNEQTTNPSRMGHLLPECQMWPDLAMRFLKDVM